MKINFNKNFKQGFTLIELLVVIAIIGVLAAIVSISLSSARNSGGDASVKSNLDTLRSQAAIFYTTNNSYLPAGGSTFAIATCPAKDVSGGTNMMSKDAVLADAIAEAVLRGGNGSSCYNSATTWAVAVGLKSSASSSWCVDSQGASRVVASAPGSAINGTTFECN